LNTHGSRFGAGLVGLAILVAACGGAPAAASTAPSTSATAAASASASPSPSPSASASAAANVTGDPAAAAVAAFADASSGGLSGFVAHACAAQKDAVTAALGGNTAGLSALGIDPKELLAAISFSFTDIKATLVSGSGTTATVHVTGTSQFSVDETKFREVMKKILAAQNKPTDDATVDQLMNVIKPQMTKTETLDDDLPMSFEGGSWLICGPIG
jgi:hypothetical protein